MFWAEIWNISEFLSENFQVSGWKFQYIWIGVFSYWSTAFPRSHKKKTETRNYDKTNASYETTEARTKENCKSWTALEQSAKELLSGFNQFYPRETQPTSQKYAYIILTPLNPTFI